jgi:hypothetical protein
VAALSIKAFPRKEAGHIAAVNSSLHGIRYPRPGWAEQDPEKTGGAKLGADKGTAPRYTSRIRYNLHKGKTALRRIICQNIRGTVTVFLAAGGMLCGRGVLVYIILAMINLP